jgi:phosphatidylinositol alpha-1,6-mannosyltransferase
VAIQGTEVELHPDGRAELSAPPPEAPRPAPRTARRRGLVLVSAGLALDGGGRALAGRLLAGACAAYAHEERIGFRVLALGGEPLPVDAAPARCFGDRLLALARAAWAGQLRRRPEAYVFDLLGPARIQALLPAPLRAPYLVPLYGIEAWRPLSWDRARALNLAAAVVAISRYTLERARPFCPGLERAAVLPLALEERRPAGAIDHALLARLGEGFALIVGRMAPGERYKGHDELLETMPGLLAAVPGARLVVAGDGADRLRLAARAAGLGLDGRVTFTGFVSEATLAELYRRCAVFALPSRGEGFGLVFLEAMRAGKPCVAARGSAAEEVVVEDETALLVDPADREALAAALTRLLREPSLARRLGEAGRRRWQREFTVERFRAGLRPHLDRLTREAPAPRRRAAIDL